MDRLVAESNGPERDASARIQRKSTRLRSPSMHQAPAWGWGVHSEWDKIPALRELTQSGIVTHKQTNYSHIVSAGTLEVTGKGCVRVNSQGRPLRGGIFNKVKVRSEGR